MGELDNAIDCYHKALGFSPQDTFATDMLAEALKELSQ
jgi:hypothetical protein